MNSDEIKTHVMKVMPVGDLAFWMREIAYQMAVRNEQDSLVTSEPGKRDAVSEGRTGPEYEIRDVLDGLSRIENIAAATRFRSDPAYPAALERIREVVERIRALETGKGPREQWSLTGELARVQGELDAANQHVKILEDRVRLQRAGLAPILRSCAQTIMENRMTGPDAVGYILTYADSVERAESANGAEGVKG
jgi:hypothetical protein